MQIPEPLAQSKFVSVEYHAQNCGFYSFDAKKNVLSEMYCSHLYL